MVDKVLVEEHAEWFAKTCKWVYKQAWKHSRKHCLEEVADLWDKYHDVKDFGDRLCELIEKEAVEEKL